MKCCAAAVVQKQSILHPPHARTPFHEHTLPTASLVAPATLSKPLLLVDDKARRQHTHLGITLNTIRLKD